MQFTNFEHLGGIDHLPKAAQEDYIALRDAGGFLPKTDNFWLTRTDAGETVYFAAMGFGPVWHWPEHPAEDGLLDFDFILALAHAHEAHLIQR